MAEKNTQAEPANLSAIHTFAQDLQHAKKTHQASNPTTSAHPSRVPAPTTDVARPAPPPPPKPATPPATSPIPHPPKITNKEPNPNDKPATHAAPPHKDIASTQKKINVVTDQLEKRSPRKAPSVLSSDSATVSFDTEDESKSGRGTVITDTKRTRFTLWAALTASLTALWKNIKHEYTSSKEPTYTVASAERRKGIIQTATTKTGRDSISDHDRVVSRIRALQSNVTAPGTPVVEQDPEHLLEAPDNTSTWSNDATPAKESPRTSTPPKATTPNTATPPQPTVRVITPHLTKPTPAVATPAEPEHTDTKSATVDTPPVTPRVPPQPVEPTPPKVTAASTAPIVPDTDDQDTKTEASEYMTTWLQKVEAWISPSTLLIIGGTALMIAAVFVSPLLTGSTPSEQEPATLTTNSPFLDTSRVETISLSELPAFITTQSAASSATVELNIVNDIDAQDTHVTLLQQLTDQLPQSFYDTITNFTVGMHNQRPFILIDVAEASVAQGALYQWEDTIVRDLSELFLLPNVPTITTDEIMRGVDMRILRTNDNPVLYYGFAQRNTVLITTSDIVVEYIIANLNGGN